VGRERGLPAKARQVILQKAFEEESLPRVSLPKKECDEYMSRWGAASTRVRLRRMAFHIAWLIRKQRKIPSFDKAVDDWSQDLEWLRNNLYKKLMRFNWPII
jgi:hypothetical protein